MMVVATGAHVRALAAIHADAFAAGEAMGAAAFEVQLGLPGVFALLDERGGMLLARVAADEAEVLTLAVSGACRGRGIARELLRAAMLQAASRGAIAMFLEVSEANTAARALYRHAGFIGVGRRRRYYADGADALILRVSLASDSSGASATAPQQ